MTMSCETTSLLESHTYERRREAARHRRSAWRVDGAGRPQLRGAGESADGGVARGQSWVGRLQRTKIGDYDYARLGVFAYADAEKQTLIGGVFGDLLWDWLHIDSLWVRDDYRGRGVGSALMLRAEEMARARGVVNVHLETTTFQTLPFYHKLGFELFGELPNKPKGSSWYYLKKEGEPLEGATDM